MRPAAYRFFVSFLGALALFAASRGARAQAVTQLTAVARLDSDGGVDVSHPHPGGVPVNVVNYQDCSNDLAFAFTLDLTGTSSALSLVAWAGPTGTDCTVAAERIPSDAGGTPGCYPLLPADAPIAQAATTTATIRMQDLAAQAGSTAPDVNYPAGGATASACLAQAPGSVASLDIYFFFVDPFGNAKGVAQAYPITVATQAPTVNGTVAVGSDNDALDLQLPTAAASQVDWNIYCEPSSGDAGASSAQQDAAPACAVPASSSSDIGRSPASDDASSPDDDASADASTDGATDAATDASQVCVEYIDAGVIASSEACTPSGPIAQSAAPATTTSEDGGASTEDGGASTSGYAQTNLPSTYLCAVAAASNTTPTISGLQNGASYTIGVAATDAYGNVGPLAVTCGIPAPLNTFYSLYVDAGGLAGGGYCATDGVGAPAGTGALFLLAVVACAAVLRRHLRGRRLHSPR